MSESELYKEGGTVTTINLNKKNAELAKRYKDNVQADKQNALYQQGVREGSDNAYLDVAERLRRSPQYSPVSSGLIEGSSEALEMDTLMQQGQDSYGQQESHVSPDFLSEMADKLSRFKQSVTDWSTGANEPEYKQSDLQMQQEEDFLQNQRDQEAEIIYQLNKRTQEGNTNR